MDRYLPLFSRSLYTNLRRYLFQDMNPPSSWMRELHDLRKNLDQFDVSLERTRTQRRGGRDVAEEFVQILRDVCSVVRRAETNGAEDLDVLVEFAEKTLCEGISTAYGAQDFFDFLPSFAHDDETAPNTEDSLSMPPLGQGTMDEFMDLMRKFAQKDGLPLPSIPGPGKWDRSVQPHFKTTRLSRFRPGITISATEATPLANIIYQARCEITEDRICMPGKMVVSPGGSVLAVLGAGGWKNRDPILEYLQLGPDADVTKMKHCDTGLTEVAYTLAVDEERKLLFAADGERVKSFGWEARKSNLVHTLDSGRAKGPIAILPGGRIVRAGKGEALLWNIEELKKHKKGRTIGGSFEPDSWGLRDNDNNEIETSIGTKSHGTVKFADNTFKPSVWHLHQPTGWMLSGENRMEATYRCAAIDLEHGGKIVSRYLGHGGDAMGFSTSPGDATTFATGGSDGFARVYDVRRPLPVLTFDSGRCGEPCQDVVYVHPDGVPTLFTAGSRSEQIKMWDIRARAAVYELGTGNNAVESMAWDAQNSTLYAATECNNVDHNGYHYDYRRAKVPKWAYAARAPDPFQMHSEETMDVDEEGSSEDDEYDSEDWDERAWPKDAYHSEDFFGYAMDAGEHRMYQYAFKADADPQKLPADGEVYLNEDRW